MALFKYIVANKQGKKLNGTIETPDEATARFELNNLGFSILELVESKDQAVDEDKGINRFVFEALDKQSKEVTGKVPSLDEETAFRKLTKEYELTVTAIWKDGASEADISKAKIEGTKKFRDQLFAEEKALEDSKKIKTAEEEKEEEITKTKIETVLKNVNELLVTFDKDFDSAQKSDINKKINKLLRIKNSSNSEYILSTAEELLNFLRDQEKSLREKGLKDKQIELEIKTHEMLSALKKSSKPQSISEDLISKINTLQSKYNRVQNPSFFIKSFNKVLQNIRDFFTTPPEIQTIEELIAAYNKQLVTFILLYFKESSAEYKEKIKNSLRVIWNQRKKAKLDLKQTKTAIKLRKRQTQIEFTGDTFFFSIIKEINTLSGWLVAFYITYYFAALYLTTKDFGLKSIPQGIYVYESHTFKYLLVIIFLLHGVTSLKVNFFKKSFLADTILFPTFIVGSLIALLNF